MKILIVNGPNLNRLGKREPHLYGHQSMDDVLANLHKSAPAGLTIDYFQSNHEGALIDRLQLLDFDAVIINPGALTHYSIALADCLRDISVPAIEVHISNIYAREGYRQTSMTAPYCTGVISGLGTDGYMAAFRYLHLQLSASAEK